MGDNGCDLQVRPYLSGTELSDCVSRRFEHAAAPLVKRQLWDVVAEKRRRTGSLVRVIFVGRMKDLVEGISYVHCFSKKV